MCIIYGISATFESKFAFLFSRFSDQSFVCAMRTSLACWNNWLMSIMLTCGPPLRD